jgi:excisionase family DNA binding protein
MEERRDEWYTITEAAEKMHVSRQTIYSWIREGKIKPLLTVSGRQRIPANQLVIDRLAEFIPNKEIFYPIIDISDIEPSRTEYAGSKEKTWFSKDDRHWYWNLSGEEFLFKAGREHTGENWAEKVACELCRLLGLPHAEYELATYKDKKGVISPNFVLKGDDLILGNEILGKTVPGYEKVKRYNQRKHTVRAVLAGIKSAKALPPKGWTTKDYITTAEDVFLGYLLLDTWIGNTDRHHENWGLIFDSKLRCFYLAPTFDHASSLGRNESDESRQNRLVTQDKQRTVKTFVERAKSAFYAAETDNNPLTTYEAFKQASRYQEKAAKAWVETLRAISQDSINKIIDMIPGNEISTVGRDFTKKFLNENKNRLLGQ